MTGILLPEDTDAEVAVFYIKAAGDAIYFRLERENFTVERVYASSLDPVLERLTKIDRVDQTLCIWGLSKTSNGRPGVYQSVVVSAPYDPWPSYFADSPVAIALSVAGAHVALTVSTAGDDATAGYLASALGTHLDVIESASEADPSTGQTASAAYGATEEVVLVSSGNADATAETQASASGDNEEVMQPTGTQNDSGETALSVFGSHAAV
jgi:hypothetical protein